MENQYLVSQVSCKRTDNTIEINNVIRIVIATSEIHAIGKFTMNTKDIKFESEFPIICHLISEIITIN